ncbi:MAG: hypothetical protein M3503_01330 [Actinomycetota bacterium]|nr:hypothetical protein [Actinomycetota bacterium]
MRRDSLIPAALAAWTAFVWGTRVRNIVRDGGATLPLLVALGMVALAVVVAASLVRGGTPRSAVPALAAATVAAWAVRTPSILLGDHGAAFKIVHTALALISIALAVAALRRTSSLVPTAA